MDYPFSPFPENSKAVAMSMKIDAPRRPLTPPPAPRLEAPKPSVQQAPAKGSGPVLVKDGFQTASNGGIVGPRSGSTFESGKTPATAPSSGLTPLFKASMPLQQVLTDFATKLGQQSGALLSRKDFNAQLKSYLKDLSKNNPPKTPSQGSEQPPLSSVDLKSIKLNLKDILKSTYGTYKDVKMGYFSRSKVSTD